MNKKNYAEPQNLATAYESNEVELKEIFSAVYAGKWIILVITCLFAVCSIMYALNQPDIYKAEALLAPSSSGVKGSGASVARQLGGLASLAGIALGDNSGGDKSLLAIEVMKSRKFLTSFINNHKLLVPLLAAQSWNKSANKLQINPKLYDEKHKKWLSQAESPEPSVWEAYKVLSKVLNVSQAKDSGLVTVSIEHFSPFVAKDWVDWLIRDLNSEKEGFLYIGLMIIDNEPILIEFNVQLQPLTRQLQPFF